MGRSIYFTDEELDFLGNVIMNLDIGVENRFGLDDDEETKRINNEKKIIHKLDLKLNR